MKRLYLCAMRTSIAVGKVFRDGRLDVMDLVDGSTLLSAVEQLGVLIPTFDPDDVVVSVPGIGKHNNGEINNCVVNAASRLRTSRARIVWAEDIQDIEHDTGCHRRASELLSQSHRYGVETVARLHLVYETAIRNRQPFGRAITHGHDTFRFSEFTEASYRMDAPRSFQ